MSNWKKIITSGSRADLNHINTGPISVGRKYKQTQYNGGTNDLPSLSFTFQASFDSLSAFVGNATGENGPYWLLTSLSQVDIDRAFDNDANTYFTANTTTANRTVTRYLYITLDNARVFNSWAIAFNSTNFVPNVCQIEYAPAEAPAIGQTTTWAPFGVKSVSSENVFFLPNPGEESGIQSKYWRLKFNIDQVSTTDTISIRNISAFTVDTLTTDVEPNYAIDTVGNAYVAGRLKVGSNNSVDSDDAAGTIISWGSGENGNIVIQTDDNTKDAGISFRNSGGAYTHRIYRTDKGGGNNEADLVIAGGAASQTITTLDDYVVIRGGDAPFQSDDIGKSPGDINLIGDVSSSATSTASFGTYIGDGSQLTGIGTSTLPFVQSFVNVLAFQAVTVTHNFGTKNVLVSVYDENDYQFIPASVQVYNANQVRVTFDQLQSGTIVVAKGGSIVESNSLRFQANLGPPGADPNVIQFDTGYLVNHSLNVDFPIVQVYNSAREQVLPKTIRGVDANNTFIEFDDGNEQSPTMIVVIKR